MNDRRAQFDAREYELSLGPNGYEYMPPGKRQKKDSIRIHVILFVATVFSTLVAGAMFAGVDPFRYPHLIYRGIPFSFTLLMILLTHEMGHFFVSRKHNVDATLPYFVPAPPPFFLLGTLGAFIKMRSNVRDKRALVDIGAAGPLAGLVVAIPVIIIGLKLSQVSPVVPVEAAEAGGNINLQLGSSLLFSFLSKMVLGNVPDDSFVHLHPMAFAGWIGLFVTMLNLIPIGMLDGGHVAYAILGEKHQLLTRFVFIALVLLAFLGWPGWFVWAFIAIFFGRRHPPPLYPWIPLDARGKALGWLTLIAFIITFTPVPLKVG